MLLDPLPAPVADVLVAAYLLLLLGAIAVLRRRARRRLRTLRTGRSGLLRVSAAGAVRARAVALSQRGEPLDAPRRRCEQPVGLLQPDGGAR